MLHDIGDILAPYTHGEMVAAIFKPFLPAYLCWIVKFHGLFQLYYDGQYRGSIPTVAIATRIILITQIASSFVRSTTKIVSTQPTTRCRWSSSNLWCGAFFCSRRASMTTGIGKVTL